MWAAYFVIPFALIHFWWKKRDEMEFPKLFWLFGAFIFSCGTVHLVEALIFYHPIYRVSGLLKAATAIISWMTVFAIIRITPKALALPGQAKLSHDLQIQLTKNEEIRTRLSETNRELEAYTGRIAHDLRNPLSGVILLGDLAMEAARKGDGAFAAEQVGSMLESLRMMETSVKELHSHSTGKSGDRKMESVQLGEILKTVESNLSGKIRDSGTILTIGELPSITGNETLLIHLFTNLIENSIKYRADRPPVIEISSHREGGQAVVTLVDNGRGIPEGEIEKVFQPDYRASNVKTVEGTGVGLALCKSILEGHHGSIRIAPGNTEGCRVEMRFPLRQSDQQG